MDVVLGVAVTGPVARLALVGSRGTDVIDQSVVDLADNPIETLTETVVGTNRLLAGENHRLVGTRLCWTDHPRADQLRRALEDSGVHNVAVLSESQAVAALMRAAGQPGAALVMDDALARQPLGGAVGGDVTAALQTMMANLSAHPDAPGEVYLVGASPDLDRVAEQLRDASTMRVQVADDPTFALAAAGLTGDETTVVPAPELAEPQDRQLAYSMADDAGIYPGEMDEYDPEFDDYDADYDDGEEAAPAKLSRRSLVIGNAVIAFAVIGLASLATAIAVAVEPTASRQPVVGVQNGTPGKFMPILPSQQQAPGRRRPGPEQRLGPAAGGSRAGQPRARGAEQPRRRPQSQPRLGAQPESPCARSHPDPRSDPGMEPALQPAVHPALQPDDALHTADHHVRAADDHLPAPDDHLPAPDDHLPTPDHHLPTADHDLPAAHHHARTTHHDVPAAEHPGDHRGAAADAHPADRAAHAFAAAVPAGAPHPPRVLTRARHRRSGHGGPALTQRRGVAAGGAGHHPARLPGIGGRQQQHRRHRRRRAAARRPSGHRDPGRIRGGRARGRAGGDDAHRGRP